MTKLHSQHTFNHTGFAAGRHAKQLFNKPDQPSLQWKLGSTDSFFTEMQERLKITNANGQLVTESDQTEHAKEGGKQLLHLNTPLANLVTDPTIDWAATLINSWAIVGDVLSFYQERLINEGYIGTATQAKSIALLKATLGLNQSPVANNNAFLIGGYQFPGVAGDAHVIAMVKGGKGMPGVKTIPTGSTFRRVTPAGGDVHYFTAKNDTEIRSEWNKLNPLMLVPDLIDDTSSLPNAGQIFDTVLTSIKAGSFIAATGTYAGQVAWYLMEAKGVRTDTALRQTTVTWDTYTQSDKNQQEPPSHDIDKIRYYSLNQTLSAFGKNAPILSKEPLPVRMQHIVSGGIEKWGTLPGQPSAKPEASFNDSLPPHNIQDILITKNGIIYLATDQGVLFRTGEASSWVKATQGLFKKSVLTLAEDDHGFIYAGTISGGVYRSQTGSTSWSNLPGGYIMQQGKLKNGPSLRTSLPATNVNKLALSDHMVWLTDKDKGNQPIPKGMVLAATDNGLFRNDQSGAGWFNIPLNSATKSTSTQTGTQPQSPTPVLDCVLTAHHGNAYIVVVTNGALRVLVWPKVLKTQKKTASQTPNAKGHGPNHIPNVFIIAFDGVMKLLRLIWFPFDKILKGAWLTITKTYQAIKKFLEWVTKVDPQHWADTDLPYPGSIVAFDGKYINLQFATINLEKDKSEAFVALSTDKGIYAFNAQSGKLVSWTKGLPETAMPYGSLQSVADPNTVAGAIMLTLYAGKVYGFKPSGGLDEDGTPAGNWQGILNLPVLDGTPATMPSLPTRVYPGNDGCLFVVRPLNFMTEWPNFELGNAEGAFTQIDVVGLKGKVTPNMVGILMNADASKMAPFEITGATTLLRQDFGMQATITRLAVNALPGTFERQDFDRRTAKILIGNKELFPVSTRPENLAPVHGNQLHVAGLIPDLSGKTLSVTGQPSRALLLPFGGIQQWSFSETDTEKKGALSLPLQNITGLTHLANDMLFALSPLGIWQADLRLIWQPRNEGLAPDDLDARQITMLTDGTLLLCTSKNLYQRAAHGDAWVKTPRPACPAPLSFVFEIKTSTANDQMIGTLLLGTSGGGLYKSDTGGSTWVLITWRGIPVDAYISAITQSPDGDVFIAMDGNGLAKTNSNLTLWQTIPVPSALNRILLLRQNGRALILSNAQGGLYEITHHKKRYKERGIYAVSGKQQILDLAINGKTWTAGLKGGGVIQSYDSGQKWHPIPTGINNQIQALLPLENSWLVASKPQTILLDQILEQQVGPQILTTFDADDFPDQLDQRLISAAFLATLKQYKIKLPASPYIKILIPEVCWLLFGEATAQSDSKNTNSFLFYRDGNSLYVCQNGPEISVTEYADTNIPHLHHYQLAMEDGGVANIHSWASEILPRPAMKTDSVIRELVAIKTATLKAKNDCTILNIEKVMNRLLDTNTVSYSANVVSLVQGQIIKDEILGDGNPLHPFQSFSLKAGQLVFERQSPSTVTPVLSVTVNGLAFRQVENFSDAATDSLIYVLKIDDKGVATITFGDGKNGTLLPAGIGNVRATYRANMAMFDAADQKALYILTEPPYGVSTVTHPVDQNAPEASTANAPSSREYQYCPDRLITYADFETLAASLPNISKTKLEIITVKNQQTISLTVVGKSPAPLAKSDPIIHSTAEVMASISLEPKLPIIVQPAILRPFVMHAKLTLEDGLPDTAAPHILSDAYNKLAKAFGFSAAEIDTTIQLLHIERLLKSIPLVANVTLVNMNYQDRPPALHNLGERKKNDDETPTNNLIFLSSSPGSVTLEAVGYAGKTLSSASFPAAKPVKGAST